MFSKFRKTLHLLSYHVHSILLYGYNVFNQSPIVRYCGCFQHFFNIYSFKEFLRAKYWHITLMILGLYFLVYTFDVQCKVTLQNVCKNLLSHKKCVHFPQSNKKDCYFPCTFHKLKKQIQTIFCHPIHLILLGSPNFSSGVKNNRHNRMGREEQNLFLLQKTFKR